MRSRTTLALALSCTLAAGMAGMESGAATGSDVEPPATLEQEVRQEAPAGGGSEGGRQGDTEPDPSEAAPARGGGGDTTDSEGGRQGNPHAGRAMGAS